MLLMLAILIVLEVAGQTEMYHKKIYTVEDGLPSNNITIVFIDSNGFVWTVSKGTGLTRFDGYTFKNYYSDPKDSTSLSSTSINHIEEDDLGNLWIATTGGGVNKFDPKTETFKRYQQTITDSSKIGSNTIRHIYEDEQQNIWLGHKNGIDIYDKSNDKFKSIYYKQFVEISRLHSAPNGDMWFIPYQYEPIIYNADKDTIIFKEFENSAHVQRRDIRYATFVDDGKNLWSLYNYNFLTKTELNQEKMSETIVPLDLGEASPYDLYVDANENIWLCSTEWDLYTFNSEEEEFKKEVRVFSDSGEYDILSVQKDRTGSLWIGTSTGLIHLNINTPKFNYLRDFIESNDAMAAMAEGKDNQLWISTGEGLFKYDISRGYKEKITAIPDFLNIEERDLQIFNIVCDEEGNPWITTTRGVIKWNFKEKKIQAFDYTEKYPNNIYIDFLLTKDNKLYIGKLNGTIIKVNLDNNQETVYNSLFHDSKADSLSMPGYNVTTLFEDSKSNIWVGYAFEGLAKLDKTSNNFVSVPIDLGIDGNENSEILAIYDIEEKDGNLWLATVGGLLQFDPVNNSFQLHTDMKTNTSSHIFSITKDNENKLWMGTANGIASFDTNTKSFSNFNQNDGLKQLRFFDRAAMKSQNGKIYFGTDAGLVSFDPREMNGNPHVPPMAITGIKKFRMGEGYEEVRGANHVEELVLSYSERDFSVEYAALNFTNPKKNQYAYMLQGYNQDWIDVGNKREVTFTNLDPGNYTFKVRGSNNSGIWNMEGKSFRVRILPPWWRTLWAYGMYLLGLGGLCYLLYLSYRRKSEALRLKELDTVKSQMYTQISHEFRTPLTVIKGINGELKDFFHGQKQKSFELIERNSDTILHLVDQLLELQKMDEGKMAPRYELGDIRAFVKYVMESFESYARTKDVQLHFICQEGEINMDHDPEKMLIVISNLLSNAIKFTPPGGNVYLQMDKRENRTLGMKVTDTGIGIPQERLPHIFERFYMARDSNEKDIPGIGVGLTLTKELIELMDGSIKVSSVKGKGTVFTLELPITQKAQRTKMDWDKETIEKGTAEFMGMEGAPSHTAKNPGATSGRPVLLFIEDNRDVIAYVYSLLSDQWNVVVAEDGQTGIDRALELVPDIVLCDLMIPNKSGYEVIAALKEDERTSHVPIMVLSAMADEASRLKVFEKGADAFLAKPFNKTELALRLDKMAANRRRLQESFKNDRKQFRESVRTSENDFLNKIESFVLQKEYNTDYGIEDLCSDMAMGRTQLHNKIKALTGLSTSLFVRSLRLARAKTLLATTQLNISEIANKVGFNDPSYFTRCFTEEFGKPPTEMRG